MLSLSALPGVNFTALEAGMVISSPIHGFLPGFFIWSMLNMRQFLPLEQKMHFMIARKIFPGVYFKSFTARAWNLQTISARSVPWISAAFMVPQELRL
jgi:hypothetical protein